jgi:hypothetical protein
MMIATTKQQRFPESCYLLDGATDAGPVIGVYRDTPIVETVTDQRGRRFTYDGIAPRRRNGELDLQALRPGEWVLRPGLVYRLVEA